MRKTISEYSDKELIQVIEFKHNYQAFLIKDCIEQLTKRNLTVFEIKAIAKSVLIDHVVLKLQERAHFTDSIDKDLVSTFLTTKEMEKAVDIAFGNYHNSKRISKSKPT